MKNEKLNLDDLEQMTTGEQLSTDDLLKELSKTQIGAPDDVKTMDDFKTNAFEELLNREAKNNEIKTDNGGDNLTDPFKTINPEKTTLKGSELIAEDMAVELIDSIMTSLSIVVADKVFNKKISKASMSLSAKEKKTIEPVLKNCLDKLSLDFSNPFIALAVVMGSIYGAKGFQVISMGEDIKREERQEKAPKKDTPNVTDENGKPLSKYMLKKKGLI